MSTVEHFSPAISADRVLYGSFLSLPTEIKIKIVKRLKYRDLKRFGATCKANEDLIKSPAFDKQLYRGWRMIEWKEHRKVKLHPLLQAIASFDISEPEEAIIFLDQERTRFISAIELAAVNKNATSPPAHLKISWQVTGKSRYLSPKQEGKSITVLQIIEEMCDLWKKTPPWAQQARSVLEIGGNGVFEWHGWNLEVFGGGLRLKPLPDPKSPHEHDDRVSRSKMHSW